MEVSILRGVLLQKFPALNPTYIGHDFTLPDIGRFSSLPDAPGSPSRENRARLHSHADAGSVFLFVDNDSLCPFLGSENRRAKRNRGTNLARLLIIRLSRSASLMREQAGKKESGDTTRIHIDITTDPRNCGPTRAGEDRV